MTKRTRLVSWMVGLSVWIATSAANAAFPSTAAYPPAAEDPVVDGGFTSTLEYANANIVLNDWNVGDFYKQHRQNWTVNSIQYSDTITFFQMHHFTHVSYGELDLNDVNSWRLQWGENTLETWVFLAGDNPADTDNLWLDQTYIGSANYPTGFNDDGGFLVRLNDDQLTDRIWRPGMAQPGDPAWDFRDYYGVFLQGVFDNSTYNGSPSDDREHYEFSLTMNSGPSGTDGGIPGVPGGGGNPFAPGVCDPIWELTWKYAKTHDYHRNSAGQWQWVLMGWDDSMHPTPEPTSLALITVVGLLGLSRRPVRTARA